MVLSPKMKIVVAIVGGAVVGALTAACAIWLNAAPVLATVIGAVVTAVLAITGYKIIPSK